MAGYKRKEAFSSTSNFIVLLAIIYQYHTNHFYLSLIPVDWTYPFRVKLKEVEMR